MRLLSSCSAALLAAVTLVVACNTADPNECFVNTSGGFGGSGTMPIGAGVGVSSGDFISPPRFGTLGNPAPANPCVASGNDTVPAGVATGAGDAGDAGGVMCEATGDGGALTCGGGSDAALLQGYIDGADPAGSVACATPTDCVKTCVAKSKYCWAEHAVHPYKPPMLGDLYDCIDSLPPASLGGSYTCLYRYLNGDVCLFAYAAKLGPITLPAPPPLCVYKQ